MLLQRNVAREDITFTILDCGAGVIRRHEFTYAGGKRTETVTTVAEFAVPTKAMYEPFDTHSGRHYRLKDQQKNLIAPPKIYETVREIGRTAPGTLLELSFFGHGYEYGPVLYNSRDDGKVVLPFVGEIGIPSVLRDPDDFDPRPKDFNPALMNEAQTKEFRAAFHPDGYSWLWGCASPPTIHQILTAIERHQNYKSSGVGDEVVFTFRGFNDIQVGVLNSWIGNEAGQVFDKSSVSVEFKYLKHMFRKLSSVGYAQNLAWTSGVRTYAALVPTYSVPEGAGRLSRIDPSGSSHIRFYQNYLGVTLDPEGRNFGVYEPRFELKEP
jgi:hypothetical protein